jgi:hypothetical protein
MVVRFATHKKAFPFLKIVEFEFEHSGIITIELIIIIIKFMFIPFFM